MSVVMKRRDEDECGAENGKLTDGFTARAMTAGGVDQGAKISSLLSVLKYKMKKSQQDLAFHLSPLHLLFVGCCLFSAEQSVVVHSVNPNFFFSGQETHKRKHRKGDTNRRRGMTRKE